MWSEFAEKPFENLVNIELRAMATDQVAEALLGYDAFANPSARHKIWRYLGLPRPKGLVLDPSHWGGGTQPTQTQIGAQVSTSLILQYKRCEYMVRSNAGQSHLWDGEHYYRFGVADLQQTVLKRLEDNVGASAAVRYVAPAFHTFRQLVSHHSSGTGLAHSGFVAPGGLQGHRYWTYICAGREGIANPYLPLPFETFDELRATLTDAAKATPKATVQAVAQAMIATAVAAAAGELEANRLDLDSAEDEAREGILDSPGQPILRIDVGPASELGRPAIERLIRTPEPPDGLDVDLESLVALRQATAAASILGVDWMLCMVQPPVLQTG